jgi:molybdopterin biosynthesis enzyme/cell wall assembly regulator SMI1
MRVTAEDVLAIEDVPRWPIAEYSGYGLRACDARLSATGGPAVLNLIPGIAPRYARIEKPYIDPLRPNQAIDVGTHSALPENADVVVPHNADAAPESVAATQVWLRRPPSAGSGVISRASDVASGQILVQKGQRITSERLAVLIAAGVRQLKVAKRPRVGVVVSSYDRCALGMPSERWQSIDACGPYVRTVLQRWGYEVPGVEYLVPQVLHGLSPTERAHAEKTYRATVERLLERYDLIIGSGMTTSEMWLSKGLNNTPGFRISGGRRDEIKQRPGNLASIAMSMHRTPPYTEVFKFVDDLGRPRGSRSVYHADQATLVNLPGFLSSVAVLMHVMVRRIIDLYEFVEVPGPYWEIGELASDVQCDRKTNLMLWAKIVWGPQGTPLIDPLPAQEPHRVYPFVDAEVIAAIPASQGRLAAGSRVHFLRLDSMRQPAEPNCATPEPIEIITEAAASTESDSLQRQMNVSEAWSCLDGWLQSMPDAIPGGFNPPASDDEVQLLEQAIGMKLPADFVSSLKTHNGQVDQSGGCFDGESLLDVQGILREWRCWRDLTAKGEFKGMSSDADGGVKDDWFNLKWIPITRNGSGDGLCLDLDPAPGGTFGQVIRMWHDDDHRERVAASFEQWLGRMVLDITGLGQ